MNTLVTPFRLACARLFLACALGAFSLSASEAPRPWPADQFRPLTLQRIASLPAPEQDVWRDYWNRSQELASNHASKRAPEISSLVPLSSPPKGGAHTYGLKLNASRSWYAGPEAFTIAGRIVARQTAVGAWNKGNDYLKEVAKDSEPGTPWSNGTFDNDATVAELRFLALVNEASPGKPEAEAWRAAFLRGLHYCFSAQYPNGGFPQIYPLVGGYHDNITYNDDAMIRVLALFRDVAKGGKPFAFVPEADRLEAERRLALGLRCIFATQVRDGAGSPTAWDQQYDALGETPAAARNFEPVCLCAAESAEIVRFLMSLDKPTPEVLRAVAGAVTWFRKVALPEVSWDRHGASGGLVRTPGAQPLWARMYEIGTNKPIFGDRDRMIHYAVEEISAERRAGYGWFGTWPASILEDYAAWAKSHTADAR